MFNGCAACKAKDDEIRHLRSLVDSILMGKGLAPVHAGSGREPQEIDVPEKINADATVVTTHGGDDS